METFLYQNNSPLSVLAIIPARSGSKRIKNKNLLNFNGVSLLQKACLLAEECSWIDNYIVSTDSPVYLSKCQTGSSKHLDIGLRPQALSTDTSSDLDLFTFIHAKICDLGRKYDLYVHLRPTYPLTSPGELSSAIDKLMKSPNSSSLKSVQILDLIPQKTWLLSEDGLHLDPIKNFNTEDSSLPSQSLQGSLLAQTASIDIYRDEILSQGKLWGNHILAYYHGDVKADIDSATDIISAYHCYDLLKAKKSTLNQSITICFDIDGVIFSRVPDGDYSKALPYQPVIDILEKLYKSHKFTIILYTARGSRTGKDWISTTEKSLEKYNIKYHHLIFGKPYADFYVDDRSTSLEDVVYLLD